MPVTGMVEKAAAVLPLGEVSHTSWIVGWLGVKAGMLDSDSSKISCPYRDSNSYPCVLLYPAAVPVVTPDCKSMHSERAVKEFRPVILLTI
jgi:hypothetical protein